MASRTALLITVAMAVVVVVGALRPLTTEHSWYRVGGSGGWKVGVDYDAWASDKMFRVGDTLEFAYSNDNVVILLDDESSYNKCTVLSNARTLISGKDDVDLKHAGKWFFISSVKGHCDSGMKLAIEVVDN